MKVGLLVEGKTDDHALKILVGRMLSERRDGIGIEVRQNRGHGDLLSYADKVKRLIDPLMNLHPDITSIVVVVDRDSKVERKRMADDMERSLFALRVNPLPRYCLAIESLESWLSADSRSLGQYLGIRNPSVPPLEMYDPVAWLKAQFRRADKRFDKKVVCQRLAEMVNVEQIALHNASFALFRDLILSTVFGA